MYSTHEKRVMKTNLTEKKKKKKIKTFFVLKYVMYVQLKILKNQIGHQHSLQNTSFTLSSEIDETYFTERKNHILMFTNGEKYLPLNNILYTKNGKETYLHNFFTIIENMSEENYWAKVSILVLIF